MPFQESQMDEARLLLCPGRFLTELKFSGSTSIPGLISGLRMILNTAHWPLFV